MQHAPNHVIFQINCIELMGFTVECDTHTM